MKKGKDQDGKPPEMPFQVDHKLGVDITTQVADGMRQAILSGFYKPGDVLVITLANKGNVPVHADPIDLILYDPVREADAIADALIAYLDTGAAPGTITLESTFVAGEG